MPDRKAAPDVPNSLLPVPGRPLRQDPKTSFSKKSGAGSRREKLSKKANPFRMAKEVREATPESLEFQRGREASGSLQSPVTMKRKSFLADERFLRKLGKMQCTRQR